MRLSWMSLVGVWLCIVVGSGCPKDETPAAPVSAPPSGSGAPAAAAGLPADSPYLQLRQLLKLDVEDKTRALKLAPLVRSICKSEASRTQLLDDAEQSVKLGGAEARVYVEDVIEHVATSCWRYDPKVAYALLRGADERIKDTYRFELVLARLLAADGQLAQAQKLADDVRQRGSVHAIALEANILADRARNEGPGYRAGMFDEALKLVRQEPEAAWPIIDLTAVLSTRAHLLLERAVWESGAGQAEALEEAIQVYQRLGVAPFPEVPRSRSLDMLCFLSVKLDRKDDPFDPCARAVKEDQNLGAVYVSHAADVAGIDEKRMSHLLEAKKHLDGLGPGQMLLVVARGNETELVTWVLPAAEVLSRAAKSKAMIVTLDRTRDDRASTLFQRMLALAGVKPALAIRAGTDPLASTCVASVSSGRKVPKGCSLTEADVAALKALTHKKKDRTAPPVGLLVGRDLDAELEDFRVYKIPSILLSFRQPMIEKKPEMQLKSVADVWILR